MRRNEYSNLQKHKDKRLSLDTIRKTTRHSKRIQQQEKTIRNDKSRLQYNTKRKFTIRYNTKDYIQKHKQNIYTTQK